MNEGSLDASGAPALGASGAPAFDASGTPALLSANQMLRGMGLSQWHEVSNKDCSFRLCRMFKVPVRMSYFVPAFWAYQLVVIAKHWRTWPASELVCAALQATGVQVILQATALCHELANVKVARDFGGSIEHLMLWIFGGTYSCKPAQTAASEMRMLRNEWKVMLSGSLTHFLQTPIWVLLLWFLFKLFCAHCEDQQHGTGNNGTGNDTWTASNVTGYTSAAAAIITAMNPIEVLEVAEVSQNCGMWSALEWSLAGWGIQLNVALFLFNVFCPMYPADGSKLLVWTLLFVCKVSIQTAALILIGVTYVISIALTSLGGYCTYLMFVSITKSQYDAWKFQYTFGALVGWMSAQCGLEAKYIWKLRRDRQLHTHPLFYFARSVSLVQRDPLGVFHRINNSNEDDEGFTVRVRVGSASRRIFASIFRCFGSRAETADNGAAHDAIPRAPSPEDELRNSQLRDQRGPHLDRLERNNRRRS